MSSKIWKSILKDDVKKFENYIKGESKIDLNSFNKEGLTILLYGIEKGCYECCSYLIYNNNVDIYLKDKKELENALMKSMRAGYEMINVSKLLIEKKIDINEKNKSGKTSLHIASENNYLKGIELLLKNNVDINTVDNQNNTPLMCSIKRNNEASAFLLIDNNADVNIKDNDMNSVLHICAKEHLSNVAQYILASNKVDIENCLDKENNSPLHIAAKENLKGLCDLFLSYKFDKALKNRNNQTYSNILKKNEMDYILKEEEKKKNYEQKEIRKRKNYEEAMLKTEVSNFLIQYNLESFITQFYKHNYIYVDSAFLNINESILKKMNFNRDERKQIFDSIKQFFKEKEEQENETELRNQQLIEEQNRTRNLKFTIYVIFFIFTSLLVYSLYVFILIKKKKRL